MEKDDTHLKSWAKYYIMDLDINEEFTQKKIERILSFMDKIVVLFPGIGYTCDKPLLYYSGKIAVSAGYQLKQVNYGGFPSGVKGNPEKMKQAFYMALEQAESILSGTDWKAFDEILFISKSVGTVVAGAYAAKHQLKVRNILYTPLAETFMFRYPDSIAFHGTKDPWAETENIKNLCSKADIPLYLTEYANHSLETGNMIGDIAEIQRIMTITKDFILKTGGSCDD